MDTPEFEVSQNQVDSKGTFGPGRPPEVSAEPLGRIEYPSVPCEYANCGSGIVVPTFLLQLNCRVRKSPRMGAQSPPSGKAFR